MVYQDQKTKFLFLRPVRYKHSVDVAEELSKIFYTWGAPWILQSDHGRNFITDVIDELQLLWPHSKIFIGGPKFPQTQKIDDMCSVIIEKDLRNWMIKKGTTNWSRGCYEIQVIYLSLKN